jgi:glycosyltransferase involved in cell wall biosynthesis
MATRSLRLLTLLEADSLTGPAKAFVEFCASAAIDACVVLFQRSHWSLQDQEPYAALTRTLHAIGARHELIPERCRFDIRVISRLREIVFRLQPDIIESHSVKSHAVVWSSGLWKRTPWLAYHHGYTAPDVKMRVYNVTDSLTLRNADRVVTVARAFRPALLRRGVQPGRLCVIQNALGTVTAPKQWQRSAARRALLLSDATAAVLSVGRLSSEKGVADLLRAFAVLAKDEPRRCMLVIVGDGPERKNLENLAQELRIAECTRFAGHVADPSLFYAAADVLAIPSLSEGAPYALLEALAAGLPVVATAVGGIPEMVSDGINAVLVPPRKPETLASAIAGLLHDPDLAGHLVAAGKRRVAGEFASQVRADRLLGLYSEVIRQRRATERVR